MEKLKVGDVVQLKSGGPVMTIAAYAPTGRTVAGSRGPEPILSDTIVVCQWFDTNSLKSGNFDINTIEIFK